VWSLTSLRTKSISGPRKFRSSPLKDFFNSICQERKSPLGAAGAVATGLERFDQASPVGTIAAVSTIKITLLSGARVQCNTPFGTVKP
jgi:hypothetical protein